MPHLALSTSLSVARPLNEDVNMLQNAEFFTLSPRKIYTLENALTASSNSSRFLNILWQVLCTIVSFGHEVTVTNIDKLLHNFCFREYNLHMNLLNKCMEPRRPMYSGCLFSLAMCVSHVIRTYVFYMYILKCNWSLHSLCLCLTPLELGIGAMETCGICSGSIHLLMSVPQILAPSYSIRCRHDKNDKHSILFLNHLYINV